MNKTGILQWLSDFNMEEDRERIIDNTIECIKTCIDKHNLAGYDNSLNRLSDVFDLVFSYVKIEVAPDNNSSEQDIADYNSLMSESSDLPLIVYEYVKDCYPHTSHSKEDVKYCEYFIENYQNVCSFKKKVVSLQRK